MRNHFVILFIWLVILIPGSPLGILSSQTLEAQISSPVIYSEADISLTSPAFYETWSCAFQGTDVWTDSIYTSYAWSNGATTPRTHVNTPQFNSDTLTLTVTDGMGNSATSTVVLEAVLTQNQNVLYSMNPNGCTGDDIDLYTWIDQDYYLIWNWGDTIYNEFQCDLSFNPNDCVMFVNSSGSYSYERFEYATGCWYQSFNIFATIVNTPALPTITQSNDTLYASGPGPNFQWFDANQNPISGATNNWYVPTVSGDYFVEAVDPSFGLNCSSGLAGPFNITVVGLVDGLSDQVLVFPNPTDNWVEIQADEEVLGVEVYDSRGRKVLASEGDLELIDLEGEANGMYWFRIRTESGTGTFKVLKK